MQENSEVGGVDRVPPFCMSGMSNGMSMGWNSWMDRNERLKMGCSKEGHYDQWGGKLDSEDTE